MSVLQHLFHKKTITGLLAPVAKNVWTRLVKSGRGVRSGLVLVGQHQHWWQHQSTLDGAAPTPNSKSVVLWCYVVAKNGETRLVKSVAR